MYLYSFSVKQEILWLSILQHVITTIGCIKKNSKRRSSDPYLINLYLQIRGFSRLSTSYGYLNCLIVSRCFDKKFLLGFSGSEQCQSYITPDHNQGRLILSLDILWKIQSNSSKKFLRSTLSRRKAVHAKVTWNRVEKQIMDSWKCQVKSKCKVAGKLVKNNFDLTYTSSLCPRAYRKVFIMSYKRALNAWIFGHRNPARVNPSWSELYVW
jgi:hypothetical protein